MVNLDWKVMWCERHLEPFRKNWPGGAGVAMVELFNKAVAMPAVIDAADHNTDNLDSALLRFAPICCFVSHDALKAVYKKAGVKYGGN